ncbi:MAG: hypothetical protein PHQ75_13590, partial [Thermoguttaceae bacterium]|nr:hypothetical protein [Thermoguttaceae bacterium]
MCEFLEQFLPDCQVAQAAQILQDDDVFGDSVVKKKAEKKAPEREANPFTPQAAPDPNAPKEGEAKPGAPIPKVLKDGKVIYERPQDKDPSKLTEKEFYQTLTAAEKLILTKTPETGPEFFEAAALIARVGRPEFARFLLEKSKSGTGSPEQYAAAIDRLGPDRVLFLVSNPVIGPVGSEIANKALAEAKKHWEDPKVVDEAIQKTSSPSEDQRIQGLLGVRKGGVVSLLKLFDRLKSTKVQEMNDAKTLLKFLGDFATDAMIVSLQTQDEVLLKSLIEILGTAKNPRVAPVLLAKYYNSSTSKEIHDGVLKEALVKQVGTIPAVQNVFDQLFTQVRDFYDRRVPVADAIDGISAVWIWDETAKAPALGNFDNDQYYRYKTLEAAGLLAPVAKQLSDANRYAVFLAYYMVAYAEQLMYEQGLDKPANLSGFRQVFPDADRLALERALSLAMKTNHGKGGIIPAFLLGQSNDASVCYENNGPSILVQAASSSDRRLRFAAAASVVRLNPDKSYIGASRVASTLMHFARSTGDKKAIVADAQLDQALVLGERFAREGYRIVPVNTGGDIIAKAQADPDIELVFATQTIRTPEIRTVVQMLSNDYRTADILVMIGLRHGPDTPTPSDFVYPRPGAIEVPLPTDVKSSQWALNVLFEKAKPEQVPAAVRLTQAKSAAALLRKLLLEHPAMYPIEDIEPFVRDLIAFPAKTDSGLALARVVPTVGMQNHLINLLGDVRLPVETRRKALAA